MRRPPRDLWPTLAVALLALVVRWRQVGGAAGLRALQGYDDGVYFAAATALVHGRLPYRDFWLLHPPGAPLALAPFAALGRVVGDADAFALARVAVMVLGAVSTVLVMRLARRWGRAAMLVGGVLYAVSGAASFAERSTLLEPFGTVTLLGGTLLLVRAHESGRDWLVWAGGAVLGLGATFKLWNLAPIAVVLAWQLRERGLRVAWRAAAGAVAAALVVVLPFAVPAPPSRLVRLVLLDQAGRPRMAVGPLRRVAGAFGVDTTVVPGPTLVLTALVGAALALAGVVAWRHARGRLWVVMTLVLLAVLVVSPSYFGHYATFAAAPIALVVAAAVSTVPDTRRAVVATAACVGFGLTTGAVATPDVAAFPAAEVRAALPAEGCVASDSPATLALLDVLSRDLEAGCPVPVDFTGPAYHAARRDATGHYPSRVENEQWQAFVREYLGQAPGVVLVRERADGISEATEAALDQSHRVAFERGDVRVLVARDQAG